MNTMTLYEIYIIIHNVYYTLSSQLYVTMLASLKLKNVL